MSKDLAEIAELVGAWTFEPSTWSGAGVVPFGEEVLHTETTPIDEITPEIVTLADYMIEVMHERDGIGLAANQVGVPLRMFVHNLPRVAPPVIINPRLVHSSGSWDYSEGCLSMTVDGTHAPLSRPQRITVECLDIKGRPLRIEADELLARVFQHEIDHLDGTVYAERLSGVHRGRVFRLMADAGAPTEALSDLS